MPACEKWGRAFQVVGIAYVESPRWRRMWLLQKMDGASAAAEGGQRQVKRWARPAPSCRFEVRGLVFGGLFILAMVHSLTRG